MFALQLDFVLFLIYLHVSDCSRRITGGQPLTTQLRYMVYLVKAPISPRAYDAWICGGAIVSAQFIITSAACVDDVQFLYAIAGYDKYVKDANLETDDCTREKKKKIIYTCVPLNYELKYELVNKWSHIDVALVKVESPYDFKDKSYLTSCSYIPNSIAINYDFKYQEPGIDAMVAGWGHDERWRKPGDDKNYNQEFLHYAPTLIYDKEKCKAAYEIYTNMSEVIDKYMICTLENGNLDATGYPIEPLPPIADGCGPDDFDLKSFVGSSIEHFMISSVNLLKLQKSRFRKHKFVYTTIGHNCISAAAYKSPICENANPDLLTESRRHNSMLNKTDVSKESATNETIAINKTFIFNNRLLNTRRNGICQNDHGGPLVTWVGTHEVLIGIASVFRVSEESKCVGPYLYTSTQCNGAFLHCVLNSDENEKPSTNTDPRRSICKKPPIERGYDTIEKYISWLNHPAGPADNEKSPGRGRIRANEQYATNEQYPPKDTYAANRQYPPKDTYAANGQYPPKDTYVANEPNPPKNIYAANVQYPPKNKYAAYAQYPPKDTFAAHGNIPPVQSQYDTAKYVADPRPAAYGGIAPIRMHPPKELYPPKSINNGGKFVMRPQRPLRS